MAIPSLPSELMWILENAQNLKEIHKRRMSRLPLIRWLCDVLDII